MRKIIPSIIKSHEISLQNALRTAHFLPQALVSKWILHRKIEANKESQPPDLGKLLKKLWELYESDQKNIQLGLYKSPKHVIPPLSEFLRLSVKNFFELFKVKKRIDASDTLLFNSKSRPADVPAYYAQTFHYQSEGYLSQDSADLYDHQVEMVFLGSAQAMRRHCLVPISEYFKTHSVGKPKILDVACGTGAFTQDLKNNYTFAEVSGLDLSPWYLKKAAEKIHDVDWIQGNAENLPFEKESFDVVTCVYLYHELPEKVRKKVSQEMLRVLRPGGLLVFGDSIQWQDVPELNGSLELFPKLYYEPYFENYLKHPVEKYFQNAAKELHAKMALFTKIISFEKKSLKT
jgi:ubiquinone/menaquinone biosynthesis C-methylase UbiE